MKGKNAELRELIEVKELLAGRLDKVSLQIQQLVAASPDSGAPETVRSDSDDGPDMDLQLTRMLDHDIRSPIAAIMTAVGLLRGGLPEEERGWVLRLLDHQSAELLEQVQNYRSLSHPGAGPHARGPSRTTHSIKCFPRLSSSPDEVASNYDNCRLTDISAVLPQVLATVQLRFAERCPEFLLPAFESTGIIQCDPDECALLLELVVVDVVRRAPQDVPVGVRLSKEAGLVVVSVEDPGGVVLHKTCSEDDYGDARLNKSLGVILAKRICAEQGGKFTARADDSGARLELLFPTIQASSK